MVRMVKAHDLDAALKQRLLLAEAHSTERLECSVDGVLSAFRLCYPHTSTAP